MLQVFLAQARGPRRNGDLLRQAVDRMLSIRAARLGAGEATVMNDALIETLRAVVAALEAEGVQYAITGSMASSVHGEPWMSEGVDLLVRASRAQAEAVAERLTPRFYAPADMLGEAADAHAFTNVVDNRTGLKVDLSYIEPTGFLAEALAHRLRSPLGTAEGEFWFVTAEDVILMKLLWRKDTRSTKQWENALGVARIKGARMDWKYLFEQAGRLNVKDDLEQLRDEAGI